VGYTALVVGAAGVNVGMSYRQPPHPVLKHAAGPDADPPPSGLAAWPFVSIIVPCRNEERNLPNLLPSLLGQSYPADRYEVIVVDDQSTDSTPSILDEFAADPRLRVISGQPLPEGWKGKPWAMAQGAAVAQGEWLLFTDADTVHAPVALASAIYDAVERGADLFTFAPCIVLAGPGERLIMPIVFLGISTFYHPIFVNNPRNPTAIANGQYILVRRPVYDAVGGIDSVRDAIGEDLEFGKLVKRSGYRLWLTNGQDLMRVRMYQNFAEVWEGWRKNVLLSMRKQPVMGVMQLGSLVIGGILPFALFAFYLQATLRNRTAGQNLALSSIQIAALLAMKRRVDQILELPVGWAVTFPVGIVLFTLILLDSLRRLISGEGVTWKGRAYTR
jgi:chlorobactene glucosyltransferase